MTTHEVTAPALTNMLEARGVTRRQFLKFCGVVAASIGLTEAAIPDIARALEIGATSGKLAPVIWLEQSSCTGCTESLAQVGSPDVATVVLELLSLNYSETLSAGAGHSVEQAKEDTINAGGYILLIEGAVMEGWDGNALRIAEEKGTDIVAHAAQNAVAVVATGSCAVDGGFCAAKPNPAGAVGVQAFLKSRGINTPVVNLPACPVNPEWIISVVVDYLLLGKLPDLDKYGRPVLIFGQTIHDNCPRRGHFENGEFVYRFGSEEEAKGYCLYPVGCKGPQTYSNCPIVRWNDGASWCVEYGAPCAGCSCANPLKAGGNWVDVNAPFQKRHRVVKIGSWITQPSTIGAIVGGFMVVALTAHGFGMKLAGRVPSGAEFEKARAWDVKHPDKALFPKTLKKDGDE
ncbi:MAG: hydrogenase small subunit [Coriobacteriales bacterium]|nr:hydrogenase small subunit [Coriobacteriales bacterium]